MMILSFGETYYIIICWYHISQVCIDSIYWWSRDSLYFVPQIHRYPHKFVRLICQWFSIVNVCNTYLPWV